MRPARLAFALLVAGLAGGVACNEILGIEPASPRPDAEAPVDVGSDTAVIDAGADANDSSAPRCEAGAMPDPGYSDAATYVDWEDGGTFENVTPWFDGFGSTFDGRYVYFATSLEPKAHRYDTTLPWEDLNAHRGFDFSTLGVPIPDSAKVSGYAGVVLAKDAIYFIPTAAPPPTGKADALAWVVRYTRSCAFDDPGAWTVYDLRTKNDLLRGFCGGTFDGKYVYFAPSHLGTSSGLGVSPHANVVRYDTTLALDAATSWSSYDLTLVTAGKGYCGATFDGRYVYFFPYSYSNTIMARFDTQAASLQDGSAWLLFDLKSVDAAADGFIRGAFDGRYIYVSGFRHAANPYPYSGAMLRYDTTASFTTKASWEYIDLATMNAKAVGFFNATFDGRFVHFLQLANNGLFARFDTTKQFDAGWSLVTPGVPGSYSNMAFDGQNIYFMAPTRTVRFHAKSPPGIPPLPEYHGSFF